MRCHAKPRVQRHGSIRIDVREAEALGPHELLVGHHAHHHAGKPPISDLTVEPCGEKPDRPLDIRVLTRARELRFDRNRREIQREDSDEGGFYRNGLRSDHGITSLRQGRTARALGDSNIDSPSRYNVCLRAFYQLNAREVAFAEAMETRRPDCVSSNGCLKRRRRLG